MEQPVKMYHHAFWEEETFPDFLQARYGALLLKSGFEILNFMEHHFEPEGYTAIWLLGESHLAVHTFPEENKTYIELSSCNRDKYDTFFSLIPHPEIHPKPQNG